MVPYMKLCSTYTSFLTHVFTVYEKYLLLMRLLMIIWSMELCSQSKPFIKINNKHWQAFTILRIRVCRLSHLSSRRQSADHIQSLSCSWYVSNFLIILDFFLSHLISFTNLFSKELLHPCYNRCYFLFISFQSHTKKKTQPNKKCPYTLK